MTPLLDVRNLTTYFFTSAGLIKAVRGIEFTIERGETLALVGESGCGKSVTALSLLRLVQPPGRVVEGELLFQGEDLRRLPPNEMRRIRGNRISMVFQEPMTALNPVLTVGEQIAEVLRLHRDLPPRQALSEAAKLLEQVGIGDARRRLGEYPHQLSGGMRQRVVIAMALACDPELLIADEPTTALDVTIQAQILDLLERLKKERRMATLLITHDLGIVAETADKVAIMNGGLIMEYAPTVTLFRRPLHPYTQGLLNCIPRLGHKQPRLQMIAGATEPAAAGGGASLLDRLDPPFATLGNKLPPLRQVEPGHFVRCWSP